MLRLCNAELPDAGDTLRPTAEPKPDIMPAQGGFGVVFESRSGVQNPGGYLQMACRPGGATELHTCQNTSSESLVKSIGCLLLLEGKGHARFIVTGFDPGTEIAVEDFSPALRATTGRLHYGSFTGPHAAPAIDVKGLHEHLDCRGIRPGQLRGGRMAAH